MRKNVQTITSFANVKCLSTKDMVARRGERGAMSGTTTGRIGSKRSRI